MPGRKKTQSRRTANSGTPRRAAPVIAPAQSLTPGDLRQLEKSPSPMCVFDRDTARCLAVNDSALRLHGYTREEFLGVSLSDIRHPDDLDYASFSSTTRLPRHAGLRRHVKKSGEVFPVDLVLQDIVLDGRPAMLMLLLETTERSRAHAQRVERERLFSALVENSPDVIARIDRELRHVYINPAVSAATGLSPEQVMGASERRSGVPLELCTRWAAGARRVFASGRQQEIEITIGTADGERHYVSHMVPELGAEGRVESVLAIARDFTGRKRAELALRASESRLRQTQSEFEALADALPQVVAVFGRDMRYRYANASLERATALRRDDVVGHTAEELGFGPKIVETLHKALEQVFETGAPARTEFEHAGPEGARLYEGHYLPLAREGTSVESVLCVAFDVTDRKRAEEERLSVMSRQRDAFIREVHHRVKNNLQAVIGLLRQLSTMPGAQPVLDKAVSQLQALAIVHGLHGRELRQGVVLNAVVAEIARSVERVAGTSVTQQQSAAAGPNLHVREDDAVAVALVLNELIQNAVKHSTPDADAPVSVSIESDAESARVRVSNAGTLPAGFDLTNNSGLGTGLELVQALIPRQGAHLALGVRRGRVEAVLSLSPPVLEHAAEGVREMPYGWDRRKRPNSDRRR